MNKYFVISPIWPSCGCVCGCGWSLVSDLPAAHLLLLLLCNLSAMLLVVGCWLLVVVGSWQQELLFEF
jgi:hypothetical protein